MKLGEFPENHDVGSVARWPLLRTSKSHSLSTALDYHDLDDQLGTSSKTTLFKTSSSSLTLLGYSCYKLQQFIENLANHSKVKIKLLNHLAILKPNFVSHRV